MFLSPVQNGPNVYTKSVVPTLGPGVQNAFLVCYIAIVIKTVTTHIMLCAWT